MSKIVIYGIKNCDTVKKSLKFLNENGASYEFVDFRKQSATEENLDNWLSNVSWEILLNRRGTTWRKLPNEEKTDTNEKKARKLMLENNSIIKRPILDIGGNITVGFNDLEYKEILENLNQ